MEQLKHLMDYVLDIKEDHVNKPAKYCTGCKKVVPGYWIGDFSTCQKCHGRGVGVKY